MDSVNGRRMVTRRSRVGRCSYNNSMDSDTQCAVVEGESKAKHNGGGEEGDDGSLAGVCVCSHLHSARNTQCVLAASPTRWVPELWLSEAEGVGKNEHQTGTSSQFTLVGTVQHNKTTRQHQYQHQYQYPMPMVISTCPALPRSSCSYQACPPSLLLTGPLHLAILDPTSDWTA